MRQTASTSPRRIRIYTLLAPLLSLLALSGCGGEGGDGVVDVLGPTITPIIDTDRESSASVGPEGGVVTATGADGTEYSLSIPADALIAETEISLTPILSIDDLPMTGGFVAGVHFEPSGLELFRTATLTVTQPSAPSLGDDEVLAGFVYDGDGENLALALTGATESSFTVPVHHFSGAGSGAANPGELAATSTPGSPNDFIAQLKSAINTDNIGAIESILRQWYEARVRPRLQAAVSSDEALDRALEEYRRWLNAAGASAGAFSQPVDVDALVSESHTLAAAAFIEAIARANDLCERNESFEEAEKALLWQRRAESVLPEDQLFAEGLDRQSVLNDLCLQVVFESTSFPQSPVVGVPATLSVVVGYSFGGGPTEVAEDMLVSVLATGATPAAENLLTDQLGEATLELTPTSAGVNLEAEACISNTPGAGVLTGVLVCQAAFIVRGLVINPNEAEVSPGDTVSFAALLGGTAANVTWSASGGTIDSNGLYTAGNNEGTFQVTATGVDDPSLTATATVRIATSEFDSSLFFGSFFGDLIDANGNSYCENKGLARCVRFQFKGNAEPSILQACQVPPAVNGEPQPFARCSLLSEWFGSVVGNVFTGDEHRRVGTTGTQPSDFPCPVRVEMSVNGDQLRLSGQLKNFLINSCQPGSSTSFTLSNVTNDEP